MNPVMKLATLGLLVLFLGACSGQRQAPDADLVMLDGSRTSLAELRGQPVLATFWATTCPGCIEEMPLLVELHQEYADKGLAVIGIAMSYDPPAQVQKLVERKQLPYPIALDRDGSVAKAFGEVRLTPTSYLISPDGEIVYQKIGIFDEERVRALIEGML